MHINTDFLVLGLLGGIRIIDLVATVVFFLILVVVLKKIAWGPLMKVMEERENFVAEEIEAAELSRKDAAVALEDATAQLKQTRQEAEDIIEKAKNAGVKQEQDIIASARLEANRIKQAAQEDIRNEKENALQALQDQVASLSVLIASKVIEKEINAQDQDRLIADYIKEVGEER